MNWLVSRRGVEVQWQAHLARTLAGRRRLRVLLLTGRRAKVGGRGEMMHADSDDPENSSPPGGSRKGLPGGTRYLQRFKRQATPTTSHVKSDKLLRSTSCSLQIQVTAYIQRRHRGTGHPDFMSYTGAITSSPRSSALMCSPTCDTPPTFSDTLEMAATSCSYNYAQPPLKCDAPLAHQLGVHRLDVVVVHVGAQLPAKSE